MVVKAVPSLRFDAAEYGPVKAGEVLIGYSNEDSVRHTLILAKDNTKVANFKLVVGTPGAVDSGTVTLDAGTYTLICDVPGHGNMKATLTVE
jgi:plastocyanin